MTVDGLVVVDKPAGWTSHDAVARCRKVFGQRRVGHAGTLDPPATGVLLVGLGRVTRLLRFLADLPKTYTAELVLGVATSTLDGTGEVTGTWDMSGVALSSINDAARSLIGDIMQIPPMVSAVHVGGRRLHELARAGIEVERQPRPVTVHRFEVTPDLTMHVTCSTGTYVRSLAADLGTALGGGAHLRNLRRTAIGPFDTPVPLEEVGPPHVLSPRAAVAHLPAITAPVRHGRPLEMDPDGAGPWAMLDEGGSLLAIYERDGARLKPAVVLAEPE